MSTMECTYRRSIESVKRFKNGDGRIGKEIGGQEMEDGVIVTGHITQRIMILSQ